jgi:hypothetical protein
MIPLLFFSTQSSISSIFVPCVSNVMIMEEFPNSNYFGGSYGYIARVSSSSLTSIYERNITYRFFTSRVHPEDLQLPTSASSYPHLIRKAAVACTSGIRITSNNLAPRECSSSLLAQQLSLERPGISVELHTGTNKLAPSMS